jgi:hypothetical protein
MRVADGRCSVEAEGIARLPGNVQRMVEAFGTTEQPMAIRGSCLCGGVTFCHCNRCRKVSGSAALLTIGVDARYYRLLTGGELVQSHAAPILHQPPAYQSRFCSKCGSPVPACDPQTDRVEIPIGLFDDDPGLEPDKHIFVELAPAWAPIRDDLPRYTLRQLHKLRTGDDLPPDFQIRTHGSSPQR